MQLTNNTEVDWIGIIMKINIICRLSGGDFQTEDLYDVTIRHIYMKFGIGVSWQVPECKGANFSRQATRPSLLSRSSVHSEERPGIEWVSGHLLGTVYSRRKQGSRWLTLALKSGDSWKGKSLRLRNLTLRGIRETALQRTGRFWDHCFTVLAGMQFID